MELTDYIKSKLDLLSQGESVHILYTRLPEILALDDTVTYNAKSFTTQRTFYGVLFTYPTPTP